MGKKQYREFVYLPKEDYDKKLKINGDELCVYSKKKLKDLYPQTDYVILGETFEKKKRDHKKDIGRIELNEKRLNVGENGKHNKLFKKQGVFVEIEGGGFIAILKTRILAIILIFAILLGCIGYGISQWIFWEPSKTKPESVFTPDYDLTENDENQTPTETDEPCIVRLALPSGRISFNFKIEDIYNDNADLVLYYTTEGTEHQIYSGKTEIKDGALPNVGIDFAKFYVELKPGTYEGRVVLKLSDGTEREIKINLVIVSFKGGTVGIGFKKTAVVDLSTGEIEMLYSLSQEASHNSILQLILLQGDTEYCIAQSGIVTVGNKLEKMNLKEEYKSLLKKGHYKGKLRLNLYNELTPQVAMQPDIEIDITVK